MPLSSLDAGLTTMRQGVYESRVKNNEVKLQLVNTFLYGIHSLCFPFVLAVLVHYMIVAR